MFRPRPHSVYAYLPTALNALWTMGGGKVIKGLILSFSVQNIVNFAMGITVEFSVYKNPYNNCSQMSSLPFRIHQHLRRLGLAADPTRGAYIAAPEPFASFKGQ